MIGCVNAIKMMALPRFLYLFQTLPIFIPQTFFMNLNSIILPFIWGFKVHRIARKHITKPKPAGGLGLPNFQHYYWAANCRALMYWRDADLITDSTPAWLAIEQDLPKSSLPALRFSSNKPAKTITGNSFIVTISLRIWRQIKSKHNLPDMSAYTPICHNHTFPPSLSDITFAVWKNKGLANLADFYVDKTFATFTQLKEKYALPTSHFCRFHQARDYITFNTHRSVCSSEWDS